MTPQSRWAFLMLILAQAAHSTEEYVFRLFDVFAPARFVSSLVSDDLAVGFALINAGLVLWSLVLCGARAARSLLRSCIRLVLDCARVRQRDRAHRFGAVTRWVRPRGRNGSCAARDVNVSGRHTLGSALVMASSRCGVVVVQRGSRERDSCKKELADGRCTDGQAT